MAKISHSNPDLTTDVYEEMEVQKYITWQQIEQLNLSYGTLLEIIAELVNRELSLDTARQSILNGELQ
jgi:hypothetical protein